VGFLIAPVRGQRRGERLLPNVAVPAEPRVGGVGRGFVVGGELVVGPLVASNTTSLSRLVIINSQWLFEIFFLFVKTLVPHEVFVIY
jgi:hypothetical protein